LFRVIYCFARRDQEGFEVSPIRNNTNEQWIAICPSLNWHYDTIVTTPGRDNNFELSTVSPFSKARLIQIEHKSAIIYLLKNHLSTQKLRGWREDLGRHAEQTE
jgi:hypothetical protein